MKVEVVVKNEECALKNDGSSRRLCFLFLLDRAKLAIDGIFVTGFPYKIVHDPTHFSCHSAKKHGKKTLEKERVETRVTQHTTRRVRTPRPSYTPPSDLHSTDPGRANALAGAAGARARPRGRRARPRDARGAAAVRGSRIFGTRIFGSRAVAREASRVVVLAVAGEREDAAATSRRRRRDTRCSRDLVVVRLGVRRVVRRGSSRRRVRRRPPRRA